MVEVPEHLAPMDCGQNAQVECVGIEFDRDRGTVARFRIGPATKNRAGAFALGDVELQFPVGASPDDHYAILTEGYGKLINVLRHLLYEAGVMHRTYRHELDQRGQPPT